MSAEVREAVAHERFFCDDALYKFTFTVLLTTRVVCLLGGTVTIPVIDICQVSVQPPARSVPVNCPALTRVVTAAAGEAELVVNIKCTCSKLNAVDKPADMSQHS